MQGAYKQQERVTQMRIFIENETAYLKKHMTAVLKQEEAGRIFVEPLKLFGKKRRANTYPDDIKLSWV